MNTQERDVEIGEGIYSAMYWEYDSRLGRRWNIDPVTYPWQSPYACFDNNPIFFNDILGNVAGGGDDDKPEEKKEKQKITVNFFNTTVPDGGVMQSNYENNLKASESNPSYKVLKAENLTEVAEKMKELSKEYEITNVYLSAHGYGDGPSIAFGTSQIRDASMVQDYAEEFKTIGANMSKNGILAVFACGVGRNDYQNESIIGAIANESGRLTMGPQGFSFPSNVPTGSQQAAYPFSSGVETNIASHRGLYENTGKWVVAKPMLNNPKGYEQKVIGAPSIGVHGLTGLDMKMEWFNKNYKVLQTAAQKQGLKL